MLGWRSLRIRCARHIRIHYLFESQRIYQAPSDLDEVLAYLLEVRDVSQFVKRGGSPLLQHSDADIVLISHDHLYNLIGVKAYMSQVL